MKQIWVAECDEGILFLEKSDAFLKVLEFGDINDGDIDDEHVKQLEQLQGTLDFYGCGPAVETPMRSGEFYPRIWRGGHTPSPRQLSPADTADWVSTVRATRMLYSKLAPLFSAVEPHEMQDQGGARSRRRRDDPAPNEGSALDRKQRVEYLETELAKQFAASQRQSTDETGRLLLAAIASFGIGAYVGQRNAPPRATASLPARLPVQRSTASVGARRALGPAR